MSLYNITLSDTVTVLNLTTDLLGKVYSFWSLLAWGKSSELLWEEGHDFYIIKRKKAFRE